MPIYKCDDCNYESRDKSNFSKHLLSSKHKEKVNELSKGTLREHQRNIKGKIEKEYQCPYCKNNYSTSGSLSRHRRTCIVKDEMIRVEDYHNKIIELNNIINNLNKDHKTELKEIKNEMIHLKQLHETYKYQIEKLEKENEWLKTTVTGAGSIIKSSMSTANYIITNFKDAPALSPIEDYSKLTYARPDTEEEPNSDEEITYSEKMREKFIDYDNTPENSDEEPEPEPEYESMDAGNRFHDENYDKEKFVEGLVYQYNKKALSNYLGDIIVKHYKKKDPKQQSIWNSDSTRLTYIVRELFNEKKIDWLVDKKGIKTTNYIIKPFLKHIEELVRWYMKAKTKFDRKTATTKELEANFSNLTACSEIIESIEKKTLATEILKYIAPYFYYMKNENNLLKSS